MIPGFGGGVPGLGGGKPYVVIPGFGEAWGLGAGRPYVAIPAFGGGWECARVRPCDNKGFARRPQEFLGWEVGGRM